MSYGPYVLVYTRRAKKDIEKLSPKLKKKLQEILTEVIIGNPWEGYKLQGDLEGNYSFRLSYQDRIVYSIDNHKHIVYIKRAKTHYGE